MSRAARMLVAAVLAVLLAVGLGACTNPPPSVVEVGLVTDTFVEAGPYEVRVLAVDDDGIGPAEVHWSSGDAQGRAGTVPLEAVVDETAQPGTRLVARIPGQPIGSLVLWTVFICDTRRACALVPDGEPFEFRVGPLPSSPVLTTVSPDQGPSSGGTRVELHGGDFRPGARVFFGDAEAAHVEWLRTDLVAATTAPTDPGVVDVTIENPDGPTGTLADAFTFVPSPVVESVEPSSGPAAGGTDVVITGFEIVDGSRAFFDGVPCRGQRRVDDTRLLCSTPPGRAGLVDVEVRHPERGLGALPQGFEYIPAPQIDVVEPDQGTSDGGNLITVRGDQFRDGATVLVGGAECLDVVVVSATELVCTTPAGPPGVADVVVINPDGQDGVLPGGFAFLGPPAIVEVIPGEAPVAGGIEVRVLGAGLDESDLVTFGGAAGTVVGSSGSAELIVVVPPVPAALEPAPNSGLLAVDVVVKRTRPDDQREGRLEGGLVYFWPPEITEVIPSQGPTVGGTPVVIVGRFFREVEDGAAAFEVLFEDVPCEDIEVLSSTAIACTTPPGEPGFADVTVRNHPLSEGTGEDAYFYVAPPEVISTSPAEGPTFGGERTIIRGRFFQQGALVFLDGAPCSDVVFVSAEELSCLTPSGEEGPADVRVVNIDGQEDTAPGIYTYLGVAVTPDHGLPAGFTRVRVRSAGIQPTALVFLDDVIADCDFVSSREMSCQTPPHARGPVTVRFLNPDGTGEDGEDAFTYRVLVDRSTDLPSTLENITHVEIADLDGDADLDVTASAGRINVPESSFAWENVGGGDFVRHVLPITETANRVSVGDATGDGRPDLLFAASNGIGAVLLGNDGGFDFSPRSLGLPAESSAFDAQLIDVVGDTRLDLYVLTIGCTPDDPQAPGCDQFSTGPDVLLEQGSNGAFTDRSSLVPHDFEWVHDHKLVAADLDLDGDNDIIVVTNNVGIFSGEQNRILRNRVDEGLGFVVETPPDLLTLFGDLYDIDAGDIDGDGDPDVTTTICSPDFGASEILLRNEGGTLVRDTEALPSANAACDVGTELADIDSDGDLDLFYGGTRSISDTRVQARLYVNDGTGTFFDASDAVPDNVAFGSDRLQLNTFVTGDLDGDGDQDVVVAGGAPYAATDQPGRLVVLRLE